jgi:hypothetical protein
MGTHSKKNVHKTLPKKKLFSFLSLDSVNRDFMLLNIVVL